MVPPLDSATASALQAAFYAFASFGSGTTSVEIDSKNFAKLSRDCRLLCRALTPTDVDLIFTAKKPKGGRKIGYEAFLSALDAIASKKGCSFDEVARAVVGAGGPVDNGTKAEAVRLHDDKSTFTGVYARGGPTNVDIDPACLASVCDRTPADARGVKVGAGGSGGASGAGSRRATAEALIVAARRGTGESVAAAPGSAGPASRRATGEPAARKF